MLLYPEIFYQEPLKDKSCKNTETHYYSTLNRQLLRSSNHKVHILCCSQKHYFDSFLFVTTL